MLGNVVRPKLVLVGEQPHGRARAMQRFKSRGPEAVQRALRFLARTHDRGGAFSNGGSAKYLFQTLRAANLGLRDVCIMNAIQWDGRTISDLVREDSIWFAGRVVSRRTEFVALGNVASEGLSKAGIPHRKVPHPQYVRRFFYRRLSEYGRLLTGELAYKREEWGHGI